MFRSNTEVSSMHQTQWEFCWTKVAQIRPPRSNCFFERSRASCLTERGGHLYLHSQYYFVNSVPRLSRLFTFLAVKTRRHVSTKWDTRWRLQPRQAVTTPYWLFTMWRCERYDWFATVFILNFSTIRRFSHNVKSSVFVWLLYDLSATEVTKDGTTVNSSMKFGPRSVFNVTSSP
jgi:hypothetical protein